MDIVSFNYTTLLLMINNQGQKKLKRPDRSGKGGHIGCSEGFNYNRYKRFLPIDKPNIQVRNCYLFSKFSFPGERADARKT
jgi:hypothetical protein